MLKSLLRYQIALREIIWWMKDTGIRKILCNFSLHIIIFKSSGNRVGELDQSTLYACMEISQWNSFEQLICTNKRERKKLKQWKNLLALGNCDLNQWLANLWLLPSPENGLFWPESYRSEKSSHYVWYMKLTWEMLKHEILAVMLGIRACPSLPRFHSFFKYLFPFL
jgi:hypothetical protein